MRTATEDHDGQTAFASTLTLTLSADHRMIDGALGAEFLGAIAKFLEDPLSHPDLTTPITASLESVVGGDSKAGRRPKSRTIGLQLKSRAVFLSRLPPANEFQAYAGAGLARCFGERKSRNRAVGGQNQAEW